MNPTMRQQLRDMTQEQLNKDVIEPSMSKYSSPVVLVPKKGGKVRFALNYTNLNACIPDDRYTTPNIETVLSVLHGNTIFSTIDLTDAYWSVPLAKESRQYTAFQTPDGLFQYKYLPQGMKTAGAVFCRHIDRMIGSLKWTHVLVYIDDLLIFSKTAEEHLEILDKVWTQLRKYKMTLSARKCFLFQDKVKYLGHEITAEGVKVDAEKIRAIKEVGIPQVKEDLATLMHQMRYYRKYIRNYTLVEHPIRQKVEPGVKWHKKDGKAVYSVEELKALETLRERLCSEPILKHPKWDEKFFLHTDACKRNGGGLGATLVQKYEGKEHVIYYLSRSLSKPERGYYIWELECLAMVWATRKLRMYLMGNAFTVVTDSQAAKHVMKLNDEDTSGRLMRWGLSLQDYNFDIQHRKRKLHFDADGLSKMPLDGAEPYNEGPTIIEPKTMIGGGMPQAMTTGLAGDKAFFPPPWIRKLTRP